MISTTSEIVWLHWLLVDMSVSLFRVTLMYCDNKTIIQIAHNFVYHGRTKLLRLIITSLVITST